MWEYDDDLIGSIMYYWDQLLSGFAVKAALSALCTFFTETLYGDVIILYIYLSFAGIDLVLGVIRSIVTNTFSVSGMTRWVRKMVSYLLVVTVVGLLCQSMFHLTGVTISAVNFLLYFCTLTESASIIFNLRRLGMPLPGIVTLVMATLRKKTAAHISEMLGDASLQEKVEKLLNHHEPVMEPVPATRRRRRKKTPEQPAEDEPHV